MQIGDPRLDVAMTVVILAQAATSPPPDLAFEFPDTAVVVVELLTTFLREVSHSPSPVMGDAAERRRSDPHLTGEELARLDEALALPHSL